MAKNERRRVTTARNIDELGIPAGVGLLATVDRANGNMLYRDDPGDGDRVYFVAGDLVATPRGCLLPEVEIEP